MQFLPFTKCSSLISHLLQSVQVCIGVSCVAGIVAYHKWYTRKMQGVLDRELMLSSYHLLEKYGLDYGSSLADVYFHGYLKIILPSTSSNGFVERVRQYKSYHGLAGKEFPPRLFVVVHKSGFAPNSYGEVHDRFESREAKLKIEVPGRNGIKNRVYSTPVYILKSSDKKEEINVAMEGAQCLRQLFESSQLNPHLKEMFDVIRNSFLSNLRQRLNDDPTCRELCEIVDFNDDPAACTTGRGGYDWLANELYRLIKYNKKNYGFR